MFDTRKWLACGLCLLASALMAPTMFAPANAGLGEVAAYATETESKEQEESVGESQEETSLQNTTETETSGEVTTETTTEASTEVETNVPTAYISEKKRIKMNRPGTITVTANEDIKVTLLNRKGKRVGKAITLTSARDYGTSFQIKTKGLYYIKYNGSVDANFKIRTKRSYGKLSKAKGRKSVITTLRNKKNTVIYPSTKKEAYVFQFKASRTGYVTLTGSGSWHGYFVLCDENGKDLGENKTFVWPAGGMVNSRVLYGVKKGQTIYFKFYGYRGRVHFQLLMKAARDTAKHSYSTASSLRRNRQYSGIIPLGQGEEDWYKLSVAKSSKVVLNVKGNSNGLLGVQVYNSRKQKLVGGLTTISANGNNINLKSAFEWKGTYYVCVYGLSDTDSGDYKLKWNYTS